MTLPTNLHWLKLGSDGVLEYYLDNHMMQSFRACEARFWHEFIEGWGSTGNVWFLDFGVVTHKLIEFYYLNRHKPEFDIIRWATQTSALVWNQMQMDSKYSEHPDYIKLGGLHGFATLLLQYAQCYSKENERFRVIGAELYFGKGKEVPLLAEPTETFPFRLYLCGKIDLLVDDGANIGPLDHKTSKDFRGKNPLLGYEVQDGMTGYVYAARELLKRITKEEAVLNRSCNKIWMNFLQVKAEKVYEDRFRRMPLFKTEEQLSEYRDRMISTTAVLHNLLTSGRAPQWNTFLCTNYMHNVCAFHEVHRQNSKANQLRILQSSFVKKDIWDPERVDEREAEIKLEL